MPPFYRTKYRKRYGKREAPPQPLRYPWFVLDVDDGARMPYATAEYWEYDEAGELPARILAARMPNPDHAFLLLLHGLAECYLCIKAGITTEEVDAFDLKFEQDRESGVHPPEVEPGDDPKAPYWLQHQHATAIERMMARFLNVDWQAYEAALEALDIPPFTVTPHG